MAGIVLRGALRLIAKAGGGTVEAYPQQTEEGQKVAASSLCNVTRSLFEPQGFSYVRPKGNKHCVMRIVVA